MYFVYVLFSEGSRLFYFGQTNNLKRRISEHNRGKVKSTYSHKPYKLVWACIKTSRREACDLEQKLKNLKSQNRTKMFIKKYTSDFEEVKKYYGPTLP